MANVFNIMIIDDSATECLYMSHALQQTGYKVSTVMNGREGLNRVLLEHPHCLILDVVLPDMNGYEICRYLRSHAVFKQLPIIMVSTKRTSLDASWALRQGVSRYLPKPFSQEVLRNVVIELMEAGSNAALPKTAKPPVSQFTPHEQPVTSSLLPSLIPQRVQGENSLYASDSRALLITDRMARRVYTMIDGRRNIERLCLMTRMPLEQMRNSLRLLLEQRCIQIYTNAGQKVDATLFFMDL